MKTLPLILLLAAAPCARAQEEPELLDPKVRDLLHATLSGDTAWRHVAAIAGLDASGPRQSRWTL